MVAIREGAQIAKRPMVVDRFGRLHDPEMLFIDLFCGAGGFTEGCEEAEFIDRKIAHVIACVNHDANAIRSHTANHPDSLHFTEDIRTLDLTEMKRHVAQQRLYYPKAKLCLFGGIECINFSKAKGGMERDADSRTLANDLFRYIDAFDFDMIFVENVEEFMSWGPLGPDGKPVSKKKGHDFVRWCNKIQERGYKFEYRLLNAADFGAYTSRKRFFGVFVKHGLPMRFPQPTHAKNPRPGSGLHKWRAVKEVLDFSDEGESIFQVMFPRTKAQSIKWLTTKGKPPKPGKKAQPNRRAIIVMPKDGVYGFCPSLKLTRKDKNFESLIAKFCKEIKCDESKLKFYMYDPLSEKTLARVHAGLVKYVAKGDTSFIQKYYSGRPAGKVNSTEEPATTVTTFGGGSLIQISGTNEPAGALTTVNKQSLVQTVSFLRHNTPDIDGKQGAFLSYWYGNGYNSSVEDPANTVTTKDRMCAIQYFIARDFGNDTFSSIDDPAGSLLAKPKINLVEAKPFICSSHYNNAGSSIEEPSKAITANRKWDYLMFPQWGVNCSHSTDNPSPTLLARMDKMCPYLLVAEGSEQPLAIAVYEDDCEYTVKIKQFMAAYGLIDVKMRMLRIPELKRITGFKDDYTLIGSQAEQKKYIGNAVVVNMAKALVEAFAGALLEPKQQELFAA